MVMCKFATIARMITEAIEKDPYHEYYAIRALLNFHQELQHLKSNHQEVFPIEAQNEILRDVEAVLKTDRRKVDAYLLKATLLIAFERNKEACQAANMAVASEAKIDKVFLKYLCSGKKPKSETEEWTFEYVLSTFDERFKE